MSGAKSSTVDVGSKLVGGRSVAASQVHGVVAGLICLGPGHYGGTLADRVPNRQ